MSAPSTLPPETVPAAARLPAAAPVRGSGRRSWPVAAGVGLTLALGVALRLWSRSDLWLDEAQTVAIARLPVGQIPAALRQDGAPPLYYLLLHGWMSVFGTGSARALSVLCSVLALPLAWLLGRRVGGRRTAWAALLLLAASPFAIRYAEEGRMYSLVVLLALAGGLVLLRVLERPGWPPVLGLALVAAALALTHYWCLYLLAAVGIGLLVWLVVGLGTPRAAGARRGLLGLALGALGVLPWLPSFATQNAHTGTPWSDPLRVTALGAALVGWGGGLNASGGLVPVGVLLTVVLCGWALVALVRRRSAAAWVAGVCAGTLLIGVAAGIAAGSGFAERYAAPGLPAFLLLAALGLAAVRRTAYVAGLAVAVPLGLVAGGAADATQRTQAGQIAAALRAQAAPGDVVAFCPDQLGPAVARLLPAGLATATFPSGRPAGRLDWTDYAARNRAASPAGFAASVADRAGRGAVWLVVAAGDGSLREKCQAVAADLTRLRPGVRQVVAERPAILEHAALVRFAPPSTSPIG